MAETSDAASSSTRAAQAFELAIVATVRCLCCNTPPLEDVRELKCGLIARAQRKEGERPTAASSGCGNLPGAYPPKGDDNGYSLGA